MMRLMLQVCALQHAFKHREHIQTTQVQLSSPCCIQDPRYARCVTQTPDSYLAFVLMLKLYLDIAEALHDSWRCEGALHLVLMAKLLLIVAPVKLITSLARGYTCSVQTQAGLPYPQLHS